jgi:hypothetical protein
VPLNRHWRRAPDSAELGDTGLLSGPDVRLLDLYGQM